MKQYIVVRKDLPAGAQAVQACHAMKRFTREHPHHNEVENLVLLSVPDEGALHDLAKRAILERVNVSAFEEPDFDDELTAIALGPKAERLIGSLPLALRG